mmetsp:Transcript_30058/g.69209  ORF Transcript_30058/g.69209 Transcript_30058/m.69209 type:complete len:231 (-) Transcript_30058:2309-3001(-)
MQGHCRSHVLWDGFVFIADIHRTPHLHGVRIEGRVADPRELENALNINVVQYWCGHVQDYAFVRGNNNVVTFSGQLFVRPLSSIRPQATIVWISWWRWRRSWASDLRALSGKEALSERPWRVSHLHVGGWVHLGTKGSSKSTFHSLVWSMSDQLFVQQPARLVHVVTATNLQGGGGEIVVCSAVFWPKFQSVCTKWIAEVRLSRQPWPERIHQGPIKVVPPLRVVQVHLQ